ncbi:jg4286 [Pararge aegeria aegeria]|uniref:Jg4286 protein n=1 Tax=Pararge aegeria aegeria TaxID=348720 RepID=A0A8S4QTP8_9NEOP|nr:jg4286 [Pararge aegeria aegeria]
MQIFTGEKHREVGKGARPTEVVGGAFDVEHGAIKSDALHGYTWPYRYPRRPENDSKSPSRGGAREPAPKPPLAPSLHASPIGKHSG